MTRTLDSDGQLALMVSAAAGHAARKNLRALGKESAELCHVLIVDGIDLIYAEAANLPAAFSAAAPVAAIGTVASVGSFISGHIINLLS
jgi:hypothetical protein